MARIPITLPIYDYDYLAPLACGDITPEDIELRLERGSPLVRTLADPSVQAGELSFSGYLIRRALGDRSFIGIPAFVMRGFRHRCFFVRRSSGLEDFQALRGKRIGTTGWIDTGNTWSRAALREQGVGLDEVDWWVGPVDDPSYDPRQGRPRIEPPANVHRSPPGRTLCDMLISGDLDALMCPSPPGCFYEADSPVVRLLRDYRQAERAYLCRTGIYPAFHILGVRREVFERHPWVARSLYLVFERSKALWQEKRRQLAETTPWFLAEIEESMELFGGDWSPYGVEPNRRMIEVLCEEEFAQGLVPHRIDPSAVFADFEQAAQRLRRD